MRLHGVIPANLLPLDDQLSIDEQAYRDHLGVLAGVEGVTGIVCNGHAAEVSSLAPRERQRALEVALEAVYGRLPVICGLLARGEDEAVKQAKIAQSVGADALLIFPPESLLYDERPDAAVRYFSAVARRVTLPLVAFVYPRSTGLQYSPDVLAKICAIDNVVAVKEWSLDIATYERSLEVVRSSRNGVSLLSSFSTHLLPSLSLGSDGILSGHGSVIAPLQVDLLRAVEAGELDAARSIYRRVQALTKVIYRDPMPNMYARMKEHLVMLGSPMKTYVRPPLFPVSPSERESLRHALAESGLLALATP